MTITQTVKIIDVKLPEMRERNTAQLFGFQVDCITLDQCINLIGEYISKRKQLHIVLINAAKVVRAKRDKELAHIIQTADLVGADGVPIVWASYLLSKPLPGRLNGTDLMNKIFKAAAQKGYRLYLLGAREEVIEKAVQNLRNQFPAIQIAGYRNGYFANAEEEKKVIRDIAASEADILLIGMSTPQKEKWVRKNVRELNVPVIHGVGGSFDILGGLTKRAPVWMQKIGLEWLYRLLQEPGRLWKRYLIGNLQYISIVIQEIFHKFMAKKKR